MLDVKLLRADEIVPEEYRRKVCLICGSRVCDDEGNTEGHLLMRDDVVVDMGCLVQSAFEWESLASMKE